MNVHQYTSECWIAFCFQQWSVLVSPLLLHNSLAIVIYSFEANKKNANFSCFIGVFNGIFHHYYSSFFLHAMMIDDSFTVKSNRTFYHQYFLYTSEHFSKKKKTLPIVENTSEIFAKTFYLYSLFLLNKALWPPRLPKQYIGHHDKITKIANKTHMGVDDRTTRAIIHYI